jgi:branched-chain amino acid transport system permease protein
VAPLEEENMAASNHGQKRRRTSRVIIILGVVVLALPFFRFTTREYVLSVLTFVFIYTTLGQSWNILGGLAKQFSLGHAAFFGLGAFFTAFACHMGVPALVSLVLAGILVALLSYPLGRICFAAKGPYFTIITLALAEIFRIIFLWRPELSGSEGMTLPVNFFSKNISMYYLALFLAAGSILVALQIGKSNLGLCLRSIGDDEDASAELGVRVLYAKSITLFLSAGMAALAGGTYGIFTQYLSPNDVFSIIYSLDAIFISIVGGAGLPFGPFIGALLFSILEETLNPLAPGAHLLFLGSILIAIMFLLPNGLLSLVYKTRTQTAPLAIRIVRKEKKESSSPRVFE